MTPARSRVTGRSSGAPQRWQSRPSSAASVAERRGRQNMTSQTATTDESAMTTNSAGISAFRWFNASRLANTAPTSTSWASDAATMRGISLRPTMALIAARRRRSSSSVGKRSDMVSMAVERCRSDSNTTPLPAMESRLRRSEPALDALQLVLGGLQLLAQLLHLLVARAIAGCSRLHVQRPVEREHLLREATHGHRFAAMRRAARGIEVAVQPRDRFARVGCLVRRVELVDRPPVETLVRLRRA